MKTVQLKFKERLALGEILGSQRGDLKTLESYRRAFKQVRITEIDAKELGLRVVNPTPTEARWVWASDKESNFGCELKLEDIDADRLAKLLESHTGWSLEDIDWAETVISQLRSEVR